MSIKDLQNHKAQQNSRSTMATSTSDKSAASPKKPGINGWRAVCGCTYESLALFRITLGVLLTLELVLRFRFLHPFYSEEGTLPLRLLLPKVDDLFKTVCLHCRFEELWQVQALLSVQVVLAVLYTVGYQTKLTSILSWYLYLSLTLRNTWMSYILDRYYHYLLFYSMFLPLGERWTLFSKKEQKQGLVISPATIAFKLLVVWIYVDAGWGKLMDPLKGWSYNADPLPALDTYARHTVTAQYMYALIGPPGLRLMTPVVVYIELLAAPVALVGSYLGSSTLIYTAVSLICSLHVGIALTLRNSALLSLVASAAWCIFLPVGASTAEPLSKASQTVSVQRVLGALLSIMLIGSMVAGNLWLETISQACDQSVKHIWSTLLHNRWNVFVGAEEYVTWEIAPGLLQDDSIVDVWGRREDVNWNLPGGGAPCTATARPGRWRSFPYLAGLEGEDADALWRYLCNEWDRENNADLYPGRKLVRYNFFMLQADVLPNMAFSATRKRLVQSYECVHTEPTEIATEEEVKDEIDAKDGDEEHDEL
jgi:hypothetical protein